MLPHRAPSVVPTSLDFSDGSYLAALLKQVVADLGKYKDRGAITDDTPEVHGLCFVLEKIFLHELKTGPRGNIWEFIERLQDSLPGNQAAGMLDKLRNWTRSSIGRGRAFLRLSLNQHAVVEYLQALVWNTGLLRAFYTQGAFFRNEHLVTEMMEQLELVLPLQFSLTMHFAEIDREDYWNAHRREIEDLHIRVISGRESEFKFGLLSVEGDERRRREQVRKRTGSLTRDNGNGTDPRLDMWENSEAERTGSSGSTATTTRRGSLTPASTTPPPVAIAPTPTTAPEKEIERNAEAAGRVGAKEKAMREENEAKKKKEAEEEEERKRRQEEAEKREEKERRTKEEAERQRLEDEERTVLEEAKRLEEELAWRRKQREMARKKARGSERRQRQREQAQAQADEKAAEKAKATEQKAEDEERKGEEKTAAAAQLAESVGNHRDVGKTKNEGDESESESDNSDKTKDREGSIEIRVTGVAEARVLGTESSGSGSGAEEEATALDRSGGSTASALLQVEKMLRELEERRLKLLQEVPSPNTTEHAFPPAPQQLLGSSDPDAAKSGGGAEEPVVIDSLLRDLNLTELDSLEEVLNFCEELDDDDGRNGSDRPNKKNPTSAAMAMTGRRTTLDVAAPEATTMMSKSYHERAQHLDEVLRFCDELDEALVGVEFEHTQEQRLRKLAAAGKSTDRLLSSSPGLPFLASSSFKREGVWASMHPSAADDGDDNDGHHHPRRQLLGAAAPALSVTPGKLDYLKSKLSSSPKKEMLLFHLQQKRAERELRAGGAMHLAQAHQAAKPQQPPAEPFAIEKESPAKNFSRGRTGSLLSQNLEASLATASSSSERRGGGGGVAEVVVKPALGPHKNFRNSYYSSLKLHSPSLPSPSDMAAVQARNSELRRVRSIEREQQRQQQRQAGLRGAPASASVGGARERTELPPRRQLDFERDPALTASGRSVTIGALGSAANKKSAVVRKAPAAAVAAEVSTRNSGGKRLSAGSGGSEAGAVDAPTKAKLQRPIWIFCYKCCEKTTVPDLEYDTPVPVCQLCYTTLPPAPSGPSTSTTPSCDE
ncbi:RUN domain containing protein [Acanthamoeba castellanii str. Neff]|uniref:RUN domain containing protein n=1 Tax=Acanthamoeba castellanii (strain ATCC 30010 / Neff) TaxID=1257118 RepID=L8H8U7_ACACF|nr:RUN domain containing protein [Acanthamoeba castellanii str. Neff]ELR21632.1 RUN domain containing protein [Acanthamoeba castellanii str. Neff]